MVPDEGSAPSATPGRALDMAEFPDMNPGPVLRLDESGRIIHLNRAAKLLLGPVEVGTSCWRDVCPGLDEATWSRIMDAGDAVSFEAEEEGRCTLYAHVHRASDNHIFVYGMDVTELRVAERTVKQQARELAEMARFPDMNPGPVIRTREDGCVVLANRAALSLFGSTSLVGSYWKDLCPGMTPAAWGQVLASNRQVVHEAQVGGRFLVFTHTPPTDAGNVFIYGADITEEKNAERLLAQSEKMATLGTLSAGIAHEINNPAAAARRAADHLKSAFSRGIDADRQLDDADLNEHERERRRELEGWARDRASAVVALSSLERADREDELAERLEDAGVDDPWNLASELVETGCSGSELDQLTRGVRSQHMGSMVALLNARAAVFRLLEEVHEGVGRISEIVGALREYSYLDKAPIQDVEVNRGIRNTLVILRSRLRQGIEIREELQEDLPSIVAFGSELNQVWTNLIDNAITAMDGEGVLTIRSFEADEGVCIEIEDNGPGIPREHLGRIFDAFFTTKPPGQGTGLGLHTCYSIVAEKHGGRLSVESEPGQTCFRTWLPLAAASRRGGSADRPTDS